VTDLSVVNTWSAYAASANLPANGVGRTHAKKLFVNKAL